jgi:hypothetical protein
MAEARLWLGEKTVMELDPVTGGWFLKVQIDGSSLVTFPTGTNQMISESWRVALYPEETITGSNKLITVPAGQEWQILSIWVEYTSTGTVGNRQLSIQVLDNAADIIGVWQPSIVQATNLIYNYYFGIAMPDLLSLRDSIYMITPLPAGLILSAGQQLRVWDNKAINAGGDRVVLQMTYAWRNI